MEDKIKAVGSQIKKAGWRWLAIFLLVRLILMPLTFHPDLIYLHFNA